MKDADAARKRIKMRLLHKLLKEWRLMSEYLGTIIVAAIIVQMVFFIVRGMVKDRI